jgi:hypothetical protein
LSKCIQGQMGKFGLLMWNTRYWEESVVSSWHTQARWSGFRPDLAEPKLAHSIGLQERTLSYVFLQPHFGRNTWTIEPFRGNGSEGEYRPTQYKDSVPRFPAAQDEDGETIRAN